MFRLNYILCLVPIVLFGAIGGFFYAYSVSVIQGLNTLPEINAIQAMQKLNQGTRNGVFLFTFLFTPIITLGCAALLYVRGKQMAGLFLLAAAAVYFGGSFLPTVNINVPLNHALEALDAGTLSGAEAGPIWSEYSAGWYFWNTMRAVMALIALGLAASAMHGLQRGTVVSARAQLA
ncbi:DUF1772 domain-containing protein [Primorskyibacter sp. 2E107]|uniref:anthrone oxygenase family protein n=1 Tax=Primorskyibacter sp. 2E107 TaxID=3403458 RepID=UPI003AF5780A